MMTKSNCNKTEKTFSLKRLLNSEKKTLKKDAYDPAYAVDYAFASTFDMKLSILLLM